MRLDLLLKSFAALSFLLALSSCPGQTSRAVTTSATVAAAPPPYKFLAWEQVADLQEGTEYLEIFDSPVSSGFKNNDRVPLRIFVPHDRTGPVSLVLIAHYWGASDLIAETALASDLNLKGIAAAILTLPFHMERTPPGAKSGQFAVTPDPEQLKLMMLQSEQDARRALDFADSRPEFIHSKYGIVGISLGALVAALTYALDDRIGCATFALGGADIAHVLWTSSRVSSQKQILRSRGWSEESLRQALSVVEPLTYLPRINAGKTLVVSGKFDEVMPKQSTEELEAKLQNPEILTLNTGHYGGLFVQNKLLRTVADFCATVLSGNPYVGPPHFSSFTLRLGFLLAYPQGADLGAGLDIFHVDPKGRRFGTLFFTPRGLRIYMGQSFGPGLSIGLVGSNHGVGAGLMWSIIL